MESGSLSSPEFAEFSKTVVPFLHVTTRIKGREGDDLLKVYGGTGFPTLKFLDAKGEAVAEPAGRSVAAFHTTAGALNEVASLKKRIKAGEKGLKPELLAAEMDLGGVKLAEARERLATFKKVKPAIKAKISAMIFLLVITRHGGHDFRDLHVVSPSLSSHATPRLTRHRHVEYRQREDVRGYFFL